MTPLEYLVPSRHRREFLKALRSERGGLTVRQLARRVGVAYSNAHREVDRLLRTDLLRAQRVGNALVCRWNSRCSLAKALDPLITGTRGGADEETLYGNLKRWGAPLVKGGPPARNLPLEETLGRALLLARQHPEVARVWPLVLARNRNATDLGELERVARSLGQKRTLGFFLALTGRLSRDPSLAKFAKRFRDDRTRRAEDFFLFPQGDRARGLAEENTPSLAREWFFRMNMPVEGFESLFQKFVKPHEAFSK